MSLLPGAYALAGRRLPTNGEARHTLVGSSIPPPCPGGGTDRDMVALSLYGRAPPGSGNNHDLRGTTVKLKPRTPVTRLWLDELNDMASIYGCSRVLSMAARPTLQNVTDAIPRCDMRVATTFYELMELEWMGENTRLYHLVRKSIDLAGPMQEADLGYIAEHFVRGEHRDGKGLLEWLKSHNPSDSVMAQFDLNRKVASATLTAGAPSLIALEAHCTTLLSNWAKLVGNSTNEPAGFYFHLLRSIGEAPDRSKLSALHQWLAGKVSDDASMLSRPDTVIQELVRHGRTLGLPENGNVALALQGGDDKKSTNNCQYCAARPCRGRDNGGTKKACLVYNAQKPIPASASDNERNFVFQCRAYIEAVSPKPETLKGVAWKTITDKVKDLKPQVTPVAGGGSNSAKSSDGDAAAKPAAAPTAAGNTAAPIITNQAEFNAWFQGSMGKSGGTGKVVNVIASPLSLRVERQNARTVLRRFEEAQHEQPTAIGRATTALQLFERARHGPPALVDLIDRQSLAHGAVVNMIAPRPAAGTAFQREITSLLVSHGYRLSEEVS